MPVEIGFPPERFQLIVDREGVLMPEVTFSSAGDNQPHICRIRFKVEGSAVPLVAELQAGLRDYNFPQPFHLSRRSTLKLKPIPIKEALPNQLELRLTVTVDFFDSDAAGRPLNAAVRSAEATLPMYAADHCTLTVQPRELDVPDDGDPARLRVQVVGPRDARPVVRLAHPEAVPHPELRSHLEEALRVVAQKATESSNDATWTLHRPQTGTRRAALVHLQTTLPVEEFEVRITLRLPDIARQELLKLDRKGIFNVAVRTEMPDGGFANHTLRVVVKQDAYPGWLSIDFGTTNSTVCLHDPKLQVTGGALALAQDRCLRTRLADWLETAASDALPGVPEHEWLAFLEQSGRNLGLGQEARADAVSRYFREAASEQMLDGLRHLETALVSGPERLARAASLKMHQIYHEMLNEPPLESCFLFPVILDKVLQAPEVLSELELLDSTPGDADAGRVLQIRMGVRAKQNRLSSIEGAADDSAFQVIRGRFHHSPKRYLGRDRMLTVHRDGQSIRMEENRLVQAAWGHLVELSEDIRRAAPDRFHQGMLKKAIITYPVAASPPMRQKIEELVRQLGIQIANTSYDEAVSVIFFYLLREFGTMLEVGLEAFRARSRQLPDGKLIQNSLIFDVGGGTTDVAVIQLELCDEDPWQPGEDRGAGGRYYVITPRLLGASGNLRLGGELISLHLFRLVKVLQADRLLSLVQDGRLTSDSLRQLVEKLPDRLPDEFRSKIPGKPYIPGSLIKPLDVPDQRREQDPSYRAALDVAELVLPTRWGVSGNFTQSRAKRLQSFSSLWEIIDQPPNRYGEDAGLKIALGQRQQGLEPPGSWAIKGEKIQELLDQCGHDLGTVDTKLLELRITREQFRNVIYPTVREAVSIADNLSRSRLTNDDRIDWVILSGKSCNLQLVQDEMKAAFAREGSRFRWDPDRITFEPGYAKLATSIGACYAEYLRMYSYAPQDAKPQLRAGATVLVFKVQNLLNYLPCRFLVSGFVDPIFDYEGRFYQLDGDPLGKTRTDGNSWLPLPEGQLNVTRLDYARDEGTFYGFYRVEDPEGLGRLGWPAQLIQQRLKVQYEIDNRLRIRLFLCQDGRPHFEPAKAGVRQDVCASLLGGLPIPSLAAKSAKPAARSAPVTTPVVATLPDKLPWDIAINVLESQGGQPTILFHAGSLFDRTFHLPDGSTRPGMISEHRQEGRPIIGVFVVYSRQPAGQWRELCRLQPPAASSGAESVSFPTYHRFSLDQGGTLYLHVGEAPYWTTTNPQDLATPGRVFVDALQFTESDQDSAKDPFSGVH